MLFAIIKKKKKKKKKKKNVISGLKKKKIGRRRTPGKRGFDSWKCSVLLAFFILENNFSYFLGVGDKVGGIDQMEVCHSYKNQGFQEIN